jgi:hypothetical protein
VWAASAVIGQVASCLHTRLDILRRRISSLIIILYHTF